MDLPLKRYWDLLANYLKPLRFKVFLLATLIFTTIGLQLLNPQIIRYFIDTAVHSQGATQPVLWKLALLYLTAALLLQGVGVAATYVGEDVGWQATNQLRNELARHTLRLDMGFHNSHTPGEMIALLQYAGFAQVEVYPAWDRLPLYDSQEWLVYVAQRGV